MRSLGLMETRIDPTHRQQLVFDFMNSPEPEGLSKVNQDELAGKTKTKLEKLAVGDRRNNIVLPYVKETSQYNQELRRISNLQAAHNQNEAVEILQESVLSILLPNTEPDEAAKTLSTSLEFLRGFNQDPNPDAIIYLSKEVSKFDSRQPKKYEAMINDFLDGSLLKAILKLDCKPEDIHIMLVNLSNHLIQSQLVAQEEKQHRELDASPVAPEYADGKSYAIGGNIRRVPR